MSRDSRNYTRLIFEKQWEYHVNDTKEEHTNLLVLHLANVIFHIRVVQIPARLALMLSIGKHHDLLLINCGKYQSVLLIQSQTMCEQGVESNYLAQALFCYQQRLVQ